MPSPSTNLWLHDEQRYRELQNDPPASVPRELSGEYHGPSAVEIWERRHEILGVHSVFAEKGMVASPAPESDRG